MRRNWPKLVPLALKIDTSAVFSCESHFFYNLCTLTGETTEDFFSLF